MKSKKSSIPYRTRVARITKFQKKYKYNPNLQLQDIAENLYQDVGEVSLVLINLRLKQAESIIADQLTEHE